MKVLCKRSSVPLFLLSVLVGMTVTIVSVRFMYYLTSTQEVIAADIEHRLQRMEKELPVPCDCNNNDIQLANQRSITTINENPNSDGVKTDTPVISFSPINVPNLLTYPTDPSDQPMIYMITPTYKRLTQKVDLIRLCQTLMLIPNITWIVVEDAHSLTGLVSRILKYCPVRSVHLHVKTTSFVSRRRGGGGHRGVDQRNKGLKWIHDNHELLRKSKGVVYFGDDDNGYDIRLFEEMRYTKVISIWPVAFVGMLRYEGPNCQNGQVISFHTSFRPDRKFPVDMAAFALNLNVLLTHPDVYINHKSEAGMLESNFLESLGLHPNMLEAKANDCTEIYVWHTKTEKPKMPYERKNPGNRSIEV